MSKALLLIGGNTGNRVKNLVEAIERIKHQIGKVYKISSVYETEPWGFECEQAFLNQVIAVETQLTPRKTLDKALKIENQLGRKRVGSNYEPRPIDIDILMFDDIIYQDSRLQIPHPKMHDRKFTLVPLAEIAGNVTHPVFDETIDSLVIKCPDTLNVKRFSTATGNEI